MCKNHKTEYKAMITHHWKNHSWLDASWGCLPSPFPKQALSLSWMPNSGPSVTNTHPKNAAGTAVTCGCHSDLWGSVGHWAGNSESLHACVPALLNPHSPQHHPQGQGCLWGFKKAVLLPFLPHLCQVTAVQLPPCKGRIPEPPCSKTALQE